MTDTPWTDDRVEQLKKLWDEGLSASHIAARLGGITRNAVIGKVHRMGLSGRARKPSSTAPRQKRSPRNLTTMVPSFNTTKMPRPPRSAPPVDHADTIELPEPFECIEEVPAAQACQLDALNAANCHWPIGDPREADFHFCGGRAAEGKPYCAHHCRISYQPVTHQRATAMRMTEEERERRVAQGKRIAAAARARREATI